jgi:hypothetical protein
MKETKIPSLKFPLILLILIMCGALFFCKCYREKYAIIDKKVMYRIDNVEYHPIGSDNTLQTTPYWKVHVEGTDFNMTQYRNFEVGDSIELIERRIIQKK